MGYRKAIPSSIRKEVMSRGKCERCGIKDGCEIHHVYPYALSEDNTTENLLWLCKKCHFICQVFPYMNAHPDSDQMCQHPEHGYATWYYELALPIKTFRVWHCKICHDRWMQLIYHYKKYHGVKK